MNFPKSKNYSDPFYKEKMMGPNPLLLTEELLCGAGLAPDALVLDLGSGQGLTSVFLAREYGVRVVAADLWSNPGENLRFIEQSGLSAREVFPVHADANELPFAHGAFDAVVCVDSYNYFGREPDYLGEKLLPFVKQGGLVLLAIAGMKRDCHEDLPPALLLSWTPEQLAYMRDADFWRAQLTAAPQGELVSLREMECHAQAWQDWLQCDNEFARGDRKSIEAGGLELLASFAAVVRRR